MILCKTKRQAQSTLEAVAAWTAQAGLTLHPTKTRIVAGRVQPLEFLGYRFEHGRNRRFSRDKSMVKLRDAIRVKTRRCDGRSLNVIIADVNRTLRGWFAYFKHSYRHVFLRVDKWVRGRLRSLLRKRHRRRGMARWRNHQQWTNRYFDDEGLISLKQVHRRLCQAAKAAH